MKSDLSIESAQCVMRNINTLEFKIVI